MHEVCQCDTEASSWNDFSPKAKWRGPCYTPKELAKSPLTNHWLLNITGVSHFTLTYDFMHCADAGFSASAIENVFYDNCYKHLDKTKKHDKTMKPNHLVKKPVQSWAHPMV